jgi:hypothetical protein
MSRTWRKPRVVPDEVKFAEFAGLINTRSSKDIGLQGLRVADNVLISDTKKITRRPGYSLYYGSANVVAAFANDDDFYVVDDSTLYRLSSPTNLQPLATGLTGTTYSTDSVNGYGYYVNGIEAGIVQGAAHLPWRLTVPEIILVTAGGATTTPTTYNVGQTYTNARWRFCCTFETADGRETAPSEIAELDASPTTGMFTVQCTSAYAKTHYYVTEPDGTVFRRAATGSGTMTIAPAQARRELTLLGTSSLPEGVEMIAVYQGWMYASQYFPAQDQSVIWRSKPLAFHLFDMEKDFFVVAGRTALMLWINEGMLIGTTDAVYQYTPDKGLTELVDYGVVPGLAGDTDAEGVGYFWTVRGICKAMPFENITEKDLSMAAGTYATSRLVYMNGMKQLITITQGGGTPFNQRSER